MRIWELKNYNIQIHLIHFFGHDEQQDYEIKQKMPAETL